MSLEDVYHCLIVSVEWLLYSAVEATRETEQDSGEYLE